MKQSAAPTRSAQYAFVAPEEEVARVAGAGLTALLTLLYVAAMFAVARPLARRFVARYEGLEAPAQPMLAGVCLLLLLSSLATEFIGIHTLFGAFLVGAVIPHDSMVARVLPKGKRPAILTFSAESLTMHHLAAVGIDPDTPVVGLPATSEFQRSIREGDNSVPFEVLKNEVLHTAECIVRDDSSVGAIVCECTNITPYSHEINRRLGVPVFDMVTLVHWFHRALRPQRFPQD